MAGGSIGSVHGTITIEYDANGVARARNELGQFVSMSELMGENIDRNTKRGARGFNLFGKEILKIFGYIVLASSAMVTLANGINVIILAAAALGQAVASGLGVLPGIILTVVAAFAIFKASIAGVADALKAAASGDADKLNEALKKLAPSAQQTVLAFRDLVTAAKPIQQAMQQAFFTGIAPQVAGISRAIQLLGPMAAQVAGSMGALVREALGIARVPGVVGQVNSVLSGLKGFLDGVKQGITPLLTGFFQLAAQVGTFGTVLGDTFGKALAKLGEFMQGINLAEQLDRLGAVIAPIIQLFKDLGSIASSVFNALTSGGGNALGVIGSLVSKIAQFLDSAAGVAALNALGLAMQMIAGAAGQALLSLLSAIAPAITALAPAVGVLATALGTILGAAFQALGPPVTALVQALAGALMPVLPQIAQAFATLAPTIGKIAGVVGQVLGPLLAGLLPVIGQLVVALGEGLNAALTAVLPALEKYGATFSKLAAEMLPELIPLMTQLGRVFVELAPLIGAVANVLVGVLVPLMEAFSPAILLAVGAMTGLVSVFATVIGWISNLVAKFLTLNNILNIVQSLVAGIAALWQWLYNVLIGNSIIPDMINGILSWFRIAVSGAQAIWSGLMGILSGIWNAIAGVASAVWNGIVNTIRNAVNLARAAIQGLSALPGMVGGFFRAMASAASSAIGSLIAVARSIPGQVLGALGNLGSLLYNSGRAIIQGLVDGIRSMIGAVSSAVSSAMSAARNLLPFSPAKEGPFSGRGWTLYSGRSMMTDLAKGLLQGRGAVQAALSGTLAGLNTGIGVGVSGAISGASTGATTPVGTTLTVHQTVNALPGMDARQVGALSIEKLAFGLSTGTSSVVGG
jgi:phage-related protein